MTWAKNPSLEENQELEPMGMAITGMGLVTCLGKGKKETFQALENGRTGCGPLTLFEPARFNLTNAYEIRDEAGQAGEPSHRATRWLLQAIAEAVQDAQVDLRNKKVAVVVGTGLRELGSLERWSLSKEAFAVRDLHFGNAVRDFLRLECPVLTFSNACSASNFTLDVAEQLLELEEADLVIAAGTDSITQSMLGLIDRTNSHPPAHLQPFGGETKGVLMGEGAAAVILEKKPKRAGSGNVKAWIRGVGICCDAFHETAPEQAGMEKAMRDAHARSGLSPDEVEVILAHGTGTPLNDGTEAKALTGVFGERMKTIPLLGLKSSIGHTSGASGLAAVITSVLAMDKGLLPPTHGPYSAMEEARDFRIHWETLPFEFRISQVNAFGFGGVNAVVMVEKVDRV